MSEAASCLWKFCAGLERRSTLHCTGVTFEAWLSHTQAFTSAKSMASDLAFVKSQRNLAAAWDGWRAAIVHRKAADCQEDLAAVHRGRALLRQSWQAWRADATNTSVLLALEKVASSRFARRRYESHCRDMSASSFSCTALRPQCLTGMHKTQLVHRGRLHR
jgi:hypothetical protein